MRITNKSTPSAPRGGVRTDAESGWRNVNTGRLLVSSAARFEAGLLTGLHAVGYGQVRRTHFNVLRNLDVDGTRMTDLATRANLTKAAMTSLVRACEDMGFVTIRADTDDGRARLVYFTPDGEGIMRAFRDIMAAVERELRQDLGEGTYEALRAGLLKLSGILDVTPLVSTKATERKRA